MADVKIGKFDYRVGRITPLDQFHIVRKLAPMAGDLAQVIAGVAGGVSDESQMDKLLAPMLAPLAKMPDGDANSIIKTCLAVCERKQGEGTGLMYSPVVARDGSMMFNDLDLAEMMQLVVAALTENLGRFFVGGAEQPPQEGPQA